MLIYRSKNLFCKLGPNVYKISSREKFFGFSGHLDKRPKVPLCKRLLLDTDILLNVNIEIAKQ